MIPLRISRLVVAAPLLIGAVLSIDVLARAMASNAYEARFIGDTISALLFAVSPFFLPFLLRYLAAPQIPLKELVGPVREHEIMALIDHASTNKGKRPELRVLDFNRVQAICVGTGASATIFVTKGLIETLSHKAVLATIAHELGHLHGKHLILQGLMFASFFFIARTVSAIPPVAAPLFLLAYFMTAWRFEFAADRYSALHVGPRAMEACCVELAAVRGTPLDLGHKPKLKLKLKLKDRLSTHPTFAARIHRLRQMKGATWQE